MSLSKLFRCCFPCNICVESGDWSPKQIPPETINEKLIGSSWERRFIKQKPFVPPSQQSNNRRESFKDDNKKPQWYDQWTISKGWMNDNRRHLMTLGRSQQDQGFNTIYECSSEDSQPISLYNNPIYVSNLDEDRSEYQKFIAEHHLNTNYLKDVSTDADHVTKNYQSVEITETSHAKRIDPYYQDFEVSKRFVRTNDVVAGADDEFDDHYQRIVFNERSVDDYHGYRKTGRELVKSDSFLRRERVELREYKSRVKAEKYIIRHIRVRIMFSLRLVRCQKVKKKSKLKGCKGKNGKCAGRDLRDEIQRMRLMRAHDEQRRIGMGKTSLKLQNMRYGRLNVLRWLLWEADMPALERATNSALALHYAAARGCLDCVKLLVDASPELSANTQMDNDVTPVYLAAQEGHLEVLRFLVLEAGGSLYVRAKDGMAPLHAASQMGCLNCVKWMIQEQGVDPNLRDGDGATPLHFAASRGHLETVRWLLRHGARLSLDKFGKSPINDAAENQQVECLNVLVQHGTTPDYNDSDVSSVKTHSCSCRKNDTHNRCTYPECANYSSLNNPQQQPFYLHPPTLTHQPQQRSASTLEPAHAPQDGLYINPMSANHRHSPSNSSSGSSAGSVSGESFYLHNPQEVIYNRVKDLFETSSGPTNRSSTGNGQQPPVSALTVKVEVHSSSSGAGSDENLSSSDLSERSGEPENDYEDIYLARDESNNNNTTATKQNTSISGTVKDRTNTALRSRSRDSGSHSRSGSASSSNSGCNVIVKLTPTNNSSNNKVKSEVKRVNEFLPKPQKYEKVKRSGSTNNGVVISNGTNDVDDKNSQDSSGMSSASPSDLGGNSEEESEKTKLGSRHSLPPLQNNKNTTHSRFLKRVVSVPPEVSAPPPPPPLPDVSVVTQQPLSLPQQQTTKQHPPVQHVQPLIHNNNRRSSVSGIVGASSAQPPSIVVTNNNKEDDDSSAPTDTVVKPSDLLKGKHGRTMTIIGSKRVNSSGQHQLDAGNQQQQSEQQSSNGSSSTDTDCETSTNNSNPADSVKSPSGPNLVNKQLVLPFIPPRFPGNNSDSNSLIKPSEYLKSISDKVRSSASSTLRLSDCEDTNNREVFENNSTNSSMKSAASVDVCNNNNSTTGSVGNVTAATVVQVAAGPPPPPLPELIKDSAQGTQKSNQQLSNSVDTDTIARKQQQPLSAISIQDLNSVQLRRTECKTLASKTMSAPPMRSMSLQSLQVTEPFLAVKTDLIAELKMSKDITGIKKMKVERAKTEEKQEKEMVSEITKQFTASNFVDQIPDKDNTGNIIPAWKRQMMAKKAAERARKELEEQLAREAEEKRLQAIPAWKRQLMAKKEETEQKMKATIYTPKVIDEPRTKVHDTDDCWRQHQMQHKEVANLTSMTNGTSDKTLPMKGTTDNNKENSKPENSPSDATAQKENNNNKESNEDQQNIIPWRAQLRKTNSKLSLLD